MYPFQKRPCPTICPNTAIQPPAVFSTRFGIKKADDLRHLFFPDAFVLYYCKANKCIWQDIFYSFYYFLQLFTKPLQILQGFCAFSHVIFIFMKQIAL